MTCYDLCFINTVQKTLKPSQKMFQFPGRTKTHIVLDDFNMDPSHTQLSAFMEHYNYYNLIKSNTCFKGDGSCIDLILTNRKYCFKNASSFETGISDHHHLIY